jgi:excisionase family DNA binding protein
MHPLDELAKDPRVATSFKWLEPPRTDGRPRRWQIRVPLDLLREVAQRRHSFRTEQPAALMTEKQACAYLNVSKRNLYCWRMAGLVPHFKIGRPVRFRKAEIDAAVERMRIG